jgi:GntR family transcriptional regulator
MADPLYRKIAEDLQRKIQTGELEPGDKLSNEEEFRAEYDASRNTVRDAIRWLAQRGLVETRPGQGTYVVRRIEPIVTTLSADPETGMAGGEGRLAFTEIIRQRERKKELSEKARQDREAAGEQSTEEDLQEIPEGEPRAGQPTVELSYAPGYVAERLRINAGDEVVIRHQQFYIGKTPWTLQTTWYPQTLVDRGAAALMRRKDIEEGAVEYLKRSIGLVQCGYRVRILMRPPNKTESDFFKLPDDGRVHVASLIRTGYTRTPDFTDHEGGPYPFRVTFTVLPADRNQFVFNSGDYPEETAAPARDSELLSGQQT